MTQIRRFESKYAILTYGLYKNQTPLNACPRALLSAFIVRYAPPLQRSEKIALASLNQA
jgi:hypothetical protein